MRDPAGNDGVLVQAARTGDRQAFALLYHRYKLDIWNLAYLTMRDYHDAEDIVQETFVKALRALSSQVDVDMVRPWLLAICRNVCLDRIRATRRRPVTSLDQEMLVEPGTPPVDHDLQIDFHRALEALPPANREAFVLIDVLGCPSHEAAEILGLGASSTLRSRLAQARRQFALAAGDPPATASHDSRAQIWGLYHAPRSSAIVLSFTPASTNKGKHSRVADLIAKLEDHAEVGAANGKAADLLEFLERLEGGIPAERRVLAVITEQPSATCNLTRHWIAEHPRWQVRKPATHASWLLEVRTVLKDAGRELGERPARTLAAGDACTPFVWTEVA